MSLRRLFDRRATVVAGLAGVASVSTSYAIVGRSPTFVAAPIESGVTNLTPGVVLAAAIAVLGDLGQQLNLLAAVGIAVLATAGIALVAVGVGRGVGLPALGPPLAAVGVGSLVALLTGTPLAGVGPGLVAGAVLGADQLATRAGVVPLQVREPLSGKRRRALATIAGAVGVGAAGYAAGQVRTNDATSPRATPLDGPNVDRSSIELALRRAGDAELDVESVGPLVSDAFYEVDIAAVDPNTDADEWELAVTGEVESSFTLDYDEIRAMTAEHRFTTLRCVGDSLNGHKMDTALWTGVPVAELLERAGPDGDCDCVKLHADDGYFQVFPLDALEPGLLAYGMNGTLLPRGHGYPLRTLVPGHWGEVNVKWLTEIELLNEDADGYWEQKGWHGTGPVTPVAKLHTVEDRGDERLLGGHAYGGTRGVDRVEVSTNGGATWDEATLSAPLDDVTVPGDATVSGGDAWRQWSHTYDKRGTEHEVLVRMVTDDGEVQPRERHDPFPRGASGWVARTFST